MNANPKTAVMNFKNKNIIRNDNDNDNDNDSDSDNDNDNDDDDDNAIMTYW